MTPEDAGDRPRATGLDVDWQAAGRWAGRLASPGPTPSRAELQVLVQDLHATASRARPLAVRASRLGQALDGAGNTDLEPELLVLDRAGWARGAAQAIEAMTTPPGPAPEARRVTQAPATAQAAGLLGLLAGRVIGQFDPFGGPGAGGRLMLVAPNVLRTERALAADPADFRLWVCVHEQTHALQMAAAPWLAEHLRTAVTALLQDLAGTSTAQDLVSAVGRGLRALRAGREDVEALSLLDLALDERHREQVEAVTAVMALLEGHADVTMDAIGVRAVPSVRRLRARMEARRRNAGGTDRWLRRLLGLDGKYAQYREGAAFVRAVRRAGGRDALEAV
ncbi:hypothetical protein N869_08020, partial [Cellulomonas bogoriensis 69B4 = DSM 16987]